jgi:hypothetical protein
MLPNKHDDVVMSGNDRTPVDLPLFRKLLKKSPTLRLILNENSAKQ